MRFSTREKSHMIDLLFTLALFCVFAASSLMVVLIGANVYKNTVSSMNANFDTRTSLTYLAEKLNQNDIANGVRLDRFGEAEALVLTQTVEGTAYETWIYQQNGELKELFVRADGEKNADSGQPIMQVEAFHIEDLGDGLFRFQTINSEGRTAELIAGINCA